MNVEPQTGGCGLPIIIVLIFVLLFGIAAPVTVMGSLPPGSAPPAGNPLPPQNEPTFVSPHVITSAEVRILESMPQQVIVDVAGYLGDGCQFPTEVVQGMMGETITLSIYRTVPLAAMCPAVIVDYVDSIILTGSFDPGVTYTVVINETTMLTFSL